MRYIGNKTRLLTFILRTLEKERIAVGSVHDAFAGTASVSRALKSEGWRVYSSDLLMSSYVFQRAYVVADAADPLLKEMAGELARVEPKVGFISRHFSPAGGTTSAGRMYFTPENAGRIDASREALDAWRKERKQEYLPRLIQNPVILRARSLLIAARRMPLLTCSRPSLNEITAPTPPFKPIPYL